MSTKHPPRLEDDVPRLREQLEELLEAVLAEVDAHRDDVERVHPDHREGARNLHAYLALRRHEVRPLQEALSRLGLSSLGRSEAAVVERLRAVLAWLDLRVDGKTRRRGPHPEQVAHAQTLLEVRTESLLGPRPAARRSRIMATVDGSAAIDEGALRALLEAGVDTVRINASQEGPRTWEKIITRVRDAQAATGRPCRVSIDLPGPKIRTGPIEPGPAVVRVRPERDAFGRVSAPTRLRLVPPDAALGGSVATLPVERELLVGLAVGDRLEVVDTRQKRRELVVEHVDAGGATLLVDTTLYFVEGCLLQRVGDEGPPRRVLALPAAEGKLPLRVGDRVLLTREPLVGRASRRRDDGTLEPARISCSLPEALDPVALGERVLFDDGHLTGVVRQLRNEGPLVEITHAFRDTVKLRAAKGLNFPDTRLDLPGLTDEDRELLPFVARHADIVALSFAQTGDDVDRLVQALDALGADHLGVIAKIETRTGFENLPAILLAAMRRRAAGVMIARGDLAVECGFERLAELQEEILWVAEAAHLPVVWATEVLANVAKTGVPSRAEITDAAMAERAECVMLNKGPHQLEAVKVLDDILRRMDEHQQKKSARLRPLRSF